MVFGSECLDDMREYVFAEFHVMVMRFFLDCFQIFLYLQIDTQLMYIFF